MTTVQKTQNVEALSKFGSLLKEHGLSIESLSTSSDTCVRAADVEQMMNEGAQLAASLDTQTVKTSKVSFKEFKKTLYASAGTSLDNLPFETVSSQEVQTLIENAGQEINNDVIIKPTFAPEALTEKIQATRTASEPVLTQGKKVKMNK